VPAIVDSNFTHDCCKLANSTKRMRRL